MSARVVTRRRHAARCGTLVLCVGLVRWLTVRGSNGALPADLAVPLAVHAAAAHGPSWAGQAGELAARQAGFGAVRWSPIRTPPPDAVRDETFWRRYREHPVSSLMTCARR